MPHTYANNFIIILYEEEGKTVRFCNCQNSST